MKMKLKPAALATLALLSTLALGAQAQDRKTYIVQLKGEPAATYDGNVSGLLATKPSVGATYNATSAAAHAYLRYLNTQQLSVTATVPNAPLVASYANVYNGFAARLTDAEVLQLQANPQVASITEDEMRHVATISTPRFLNLNTPGGVWSQSFNSLPIKGEDMVIGVVDLGVWPENLAYADHVNDDGTPTFTGGTLAYGPPPASFHGACIAGQGFDPAKHCNNKLIGAKWFNAGLLAAGKVLSWTDFVSARDQVAAGGGGHGDHTGSTAAGNERNMAVLSDVSMGLASGVAPRARIASYKVCWAFLDSTDPSGLLNRCYNSDTMAAIDQAVADGVNVINFSISGAQNTVNDPVEQAFYRAALAGVFVAAAAGNDGPTQEVSHPSPWIATVAASTHDRNLAATVKLGNGASYSGASISPNALPDNTQLIRAEDAGLGGGAANLCFSDAAAAAAASQVVLDPVKVSGKIVICTRGTNARIDKSLAVLKAGGAGMIFEDNGAGLVAEVHSVPTVMVTQADGEAIKTYAVSAGAAATSSLSEFAIGIKPAPIIAAFSSRGPNLADPFILKPDLTAPGVDVIAQVSSDLSQAQHDGVIDGTYKPLPAWGTLSGTSMATPHVAGVALLLKQAHPDWSPAAIKSAMMTTAYTTLDDGLTGLQNGLLPWSQGAGHINPAKAIDPGLVYDMGKADYVRYQCLMNKAGVTTDDCNTYGTLDATYNLNLPSFTNPTIGGVATFNRSVTNVGTSSATYTSSVSVPGFTAAVTPASLTLAPGETKNFSLTLTGAGSALNLWQYGKLVWTDGTHSVTSPIQVALGKAVTAPAAYTANTVSGSRLMTIRTGFGGKLNVIKGGLKDVTLGDPVTLAAKAVNVTGLTTICKAGASTPNVQIYNFNVPAGAIAIRFALRQQDMGASTDDNDLMLVYPNNTTTAYSGTIGSNEAVQVASPVAGNYKVCVAAYSGSAAMTHQLSSWIVTPTDTGGKFTVALPSQVYFGSTATVGLGWAGLPLGHRYLAGVQFLDPSNAVGATTLLRVETNGGLPVTDFPQDSDGAKTDMQKQ
ncbi:MAG TPA: S8 family serine peptidase [Burkholderiaceae bacterium]|jgi:subtilisin family serine protease